MRIKAKLTHIKCFFFITTIFVRAIFAENDPTTFLRRRCRRRKFGNGAVLNCEMYSTKKEKQPPLHRKYMYVYNLLIYNAVAVIITWVDG
jgi:hypothetical protein